MIYSLIRLLPSHSTSVRLSVRHISQAIPIVRGKYGLEQIDYLKSAIESNVSDWLTLKKQVLSKGGNINQKNVDAVLLKLMISNRKLDAALSFANHLKGSGDQLSLGSINGLLELYYQIGKENKLSENETSFILESYKNLYNKYKVLDYVTSERLLHALCVINEWEKALKVLNDTVLSCTPSHSAYSNIIATLFKHNKKKKAFELIDISISNKRPLKDVAYQEWINYILRKFKEPKTIAKYLNEICTHISMNDAIVSINIANKIKEIYLSIGWDAHLTEIRKMNGECMCCKETLDCLKLSKEEFQMLQNNVKDKLIVGSDLFLKTSPNELKRFLDFIEKTAPYDVVLDALNIVYAVGQTKTINRLNLLNTVVDRFYMQNKKVLLLGRKHMLKWPKRPMEQIMAKTCSFFTDDISQDDPYFITAAILSGSHTDIVSKDLLRSHIFNLKDENLRHLFRRWQWQHQWMVFIKMHKGVAVQPPLTYTPCAQKKNDGWHLPYESETPTSNEIVNNGVPDLSSWLCIRPKRVR